MHIYKKNPAHDPENSETVYQLQLLEREFINKRIRRDEVTDAFALC